MHESWKQDVWCCGYSSCSHWTHTYTHTCLATYRSHLSFWELLAWIQCQRMKRKIIWLEKKNVLIIQKDLKNITEPKQITASDKTKTFCWEVSFVWKSSYSSFVDSWWQEMIRLRKTRSLFVLQKLCQPSLHPCDLRDTVTKRNV